MFLNMESYLAHIELSCEVVISTTTDDGKRHVIDRLELPPDCSFDLLDEVLDDAGYSVARFEEDCPEECIFAIVCCQMWDYFEPGEEPWGTTAVTNPERSAGDA